MNTELTDRQITFYRENGYVVIEHFLALNELEIWRQAVDEAVALRDGRLFSNSNVRSQDVHQDRVFIQRVNLWQDHVGVRKLMIDSCLGKMASALAGVEGLRIWHDQALIKPPWADATAWHLDNPKWSFWSKDAITIWVALDGATIKNGCMYFLPGTHKTARFDNVSGTGSKMRTLFDSYPEWANIEAIPGEMKAGSCSFHNGLIAHSAGPNMTPGFRRALTCAYMPDGSTFNGHPGILSPEQLAKLKVGDLLDDDSQNPLIYHSTRPYVSANGEREQ